MVAEKPLRKALVVIDMIRDFIEEKAPVEVPAGRWIIPNIQGEIKYFRERGRPVFFVCDRHEENDPNFSVWPRHAVRGTAGAEIVPALSPQPSDITVYKLSYSAFFGTDLDDRLRNAGATDLLVCGVCTNTGILYTVADAMMRGFSVVVPETCVAALTEEDHRFALRQITDVLKRRIA